MARKQKRVEKLEQRRSQNLRDERISFWMYLRDYWKRITWVEGYRHQFVET
jgi:hypothetical protein